MRVPAFEKCFITMGAQYSEMETYVLKLGNLLNILKPQFENFK